MSEKTLSKYEQYPYYLTAGVTMADGKPVVYFRTSGFSDEELKKIRNILADAFDNAILHPQAGTPEKLVAQVPLEIDDEGNIQ